MHNADLRLAISKQDQRTIGWAFLLQLVAVIPLLIADRYNVDDWGRSVLGYFTWVNDGRPLADSVMRTLDDGGPFTDFSPLPLLFGIFLLAVIATLLGKRLGSGPPVITAVAALSLGLNPLFLANLSYKFDILPMTLGLVLAASPVFLFDLLDRRPILTAISGALLLYGSLCLYQACINVFLVLVLVELILGLRKQIKPGRLTKCLLISLSQFSVALLAYKLLVASNLKGAYAAEHSPLVSGSGAFAAIWSNTVEYWSLVWMAAYGHLRLPLLFVPGVTMVYSIVIGIRYVIRSGGSSRWAGLLSLFLLLAILVGFVLACPGVLVLLKAPTGGGRVYAGYCVLVFASFCLLISIVRDMQINDIVVFCVTAVLILPVVVFSATYANASKAQKYYETHIANLISDDVLSLSNTGSITHLTTIGEIGFAPNVQRIYLKKYPFLSAIIPVGLSNDAAGGFGNAMLQFWGVPFDKRSQPEDRQKLVEQLSADNLVKETPYYQIYRLEHDIVLRLKTIKSNP
ncbi:MAG: glucosyltransferase domain-containing protein [Verrucomicrobia bacterium]|nr:glucosyltransferase domain-containing protein [Verrucomicrobiota bacterium]